MRVVVYGAGAVGARVARQLITSTTEIVLIDQNVVAVEEAVASLGSPAHAASISAIRLETRLDRFRKLSEGADLVVLTAHEDHVDLAECALRNRAHVVSVADDVHVVKALFDLNGLATDQQMSLIVGAGFSPGFTCLLARHAASHLDVVDEIHVAKFGTGGPACARQHHKALRSEARDWKNQVWETNRGGSGRELCWFPDPVGGLDCYRAALPDSQLLLTAFPEIVRATARVAATRRDQATKWLPMLRRPHPEGMIGAVRTEVRGWKDTVRSAVIMGALDRPAVAAGTVAAVAGRWAINDQFVRRGAGGLAELVQDPVLMLHELAELGLKAAVFEGSANH